jgi:hypothetical protein
MKSLSLAAVVIATSAGTAIAQQRFSPSHPIPTTKAAPAAKIVTAPVTQKRQGNVNHPLVGGNDSCTTPAVAVDGPNPWDNTGATLDGPQPCGLIGSDVWYTYTAAASGTVVASFCGGTGTDTVLAVYNIATCPALGDLITCNDDTCNFQSQVSWAVTAGNTYMLQAGGFNGSQGTGTLTITPPAPPAPNDDCSTPTVLVGGGPFPFNNTAATTGVEGQANGNCNFFSTTAITNDVWYTWNATVSGPVAIDLCAGGGTVTDTKMAVYAGAGCPGGTALACNDDSCAFLSKVTVTVTAGQDYTFQIGNFPGASQGTGTITITQQVVYPGCRYDDGTAEDAVGINAGGFGVVWLQKFGSAGESNVITTASFAYGTAAFPGNCPPNGTPVTAAIWNDPTNDGDPTDAVLLGTANTTVQNSDMNILNDVTFSPPIVTSGVYFVGASIVEPPVGHFIASLDESQASGGRAWVCGNSTGACNLNALGANSIPPLDEDNVAPGVWLIRADCTAKGSIDPFCFGDGTGLPCPCGNTGAAGNGCGNSAHATGANMAASGTASLAADSVVLSITNHRPSTLAVLFQGTPQNVTLMYGDGIRCIGGTLKRPFKMTPANALTLTIPSASSTPPSPATLSSQSAVKGDPLSIGSVRGYQLVYRDNGGPCGTGFNATNGIKIVWAP